MVVDTAGCTHLIYFLFFVKFIDVLEEIKTISSNYFIYFFVSLNSHLFFLLKKESKQQHLQFFELGDNLYFIQSHLPQRFRFLLVNNSYLFYPPQRAPSSLLTFVYLPTILISPRLLSYSTQIEKEEAS